MNQRLGDFRQHPDIDLIDQRPVAKVAVKGADLQLAFRVAYHLIGAGTDGEAGKIAHLLPLLRQDHGRDAAEQPGKPGILRPQMDIDDVWGGGGDLRDMAEQRQRAQALQRGDHVGHRQLAPVVKVDRRA